MAYSKLFHVSTDFVLGYQTINTAVENYDSIHTALETYHSDEDRNLGEHNTSFTARDVTTMLGASFLSGGFLQVNPGAAIGFPSRLSTGVYFVPTRGLSTFWGTATAIVSSSTPIPYFQIQPVTQTQGVGLMVRAYELGTGSFVLTDFDFYLAVHGEK